MDGQKKLKVLLLNYDEKKANEFLVSLCRHLFDGIFFLFHGNNDIVKNERFTVEGKYMGDDQKRAFSENICCE